MMIGYSMIENELFLRCQIVSRADSEGCGKEPTI